MGAGIRPGAHATHQESCAAVGDDHEHGGGRDPRHAPRPRATRPRRPIRRRTSVHVVDSPGRLRRRDCVADRPRRGRRHRQHCRSEPAAERRVHARVASGVGSAIRSPVRQVDACDRRALHAHRNRTDSKKSAGRTEAADRGRLRVPLSSLAGRGVRSRSSVQGGARGHNTGDRESTPAIS